MPRVEDLSDEKTREEIRRLSDELRRLRSEDTEDTDPE